MKTTFVIRDGALVEKQPRMPWDGVFMAISDIQPFRTVDGVEISSRSSLRAYEQANGCRQVGNDYSGSEKPSFWDSRRKGNSR